MNTAARIKKWRKEALLKFDKHEEAYEAVGSKHALYEKGKALGAIDAYTKVLELFTSDKPKEVVKQDLYEFFKGKSLKNKDFDKWLTNRK